jgi:hypothetical protein
MSLSDPGTAIATGLKAAPFVRDAVPADYPAIRGVAIAAYRQYAPQIAPPAPRVTPIPHLISRRIR